MKSIGDIQAEINRLNKSNMKSLEELESIKEFVTKGIMRFQIKENEFKIKILEWVLEE